jgi:Zn-dependent protease with chaperone function
MIEVAIFSLVIVVLSLLGLIWDFTSGLITSGVDGLFLLLVCLMMGGIFSLQLLILAWERRRASRSSSGGAGK